MEIGAFTGYADVAQMVLYAFWIFFAGLIYYLRQEDKREGYPLDSVLNDRARGRVVAVGYPNMPAPKSFLLPDGTTVKAPKPEHDDRELNAEPASHFPGAPLRPVGDPMLAEVGPGSYALRADVPDVIHGGHPKIIPLRMADAYDLDERDPDPRGMTLFGADRIRAGTVTDVWIDQMEFMIRYLEMELAESEDGEKVLVPMNFARVHGPTDRKSGYISVRALNSHQFKNVPKTASDSQITLLEEERIPAYFGAGTLYADPQRAEPLI